MTDRERYDIALESLTTTDRFLTDRYGVSTSTLQRWRRLFGLRKPAQEKNTAKYEAKKRAFFESKKL